MSHNHPILVAFVHRRFPRLDFDNKYLEVIIAATDFEQACPFGANCGPLFGITIPPYGITFYTYYYTTMFENNPVSIKAFNIAVTLLLVMFSGIFNATKEGRWTAWNCFLFYMNRTVETCAMTEVNRYWHWKFNHLCSWYTLNLKTMFLGDRISF